MTQYIIAPWEVLATVITAGGVYTSVDMEIPYDATSWTLTAISDANAAVYVQSLVDATYYTIDTAPINAGVLPTVRNYAFRVPHVRVLISCAAALTASVTATFRIDVTKPASF